MEVGAHEAKTHLSRLLEEVGQGKRFTITKHGVPVALVLPVGSGHPGGPAQAMAALRRLREGITLGDQDLKELIGEGRR